jgi:hypothetical protein
MKLLRTFQPSVSSFQDKCLKSSLINTFIKLKVPDVNLPSMRTNWRAPLVTSCLLAIYYLDICIRYMILSMKLLVLVLINTAKIKLLCMMLEIDLEMLPNYKSLKTLIQSKIKCWLNVSISNPNIDI